MALGGLLVLISLLVAGVAAAQSEGTIGGVVYEDANGNGIRDEGEVGIQDVEVTFSSSGWSTTINTDDKGIFSIRLNPATWTVTVKVPAGYAAEETTKEVFLENPGDAVTNLEFPLVPADEEGNPILPESGGLISGTAIIAALFGVMAFGVVLVVVGQRRSKQTPS